MKSKRSLPELERRAVIPLARELVNEANNLLGFNDEVSRFVSNFEMILITGRDEVRKRGNLSNADLAIQIYRYKGKFDTYVFYPGGVEKYRSRARIDNKKITEQVPDGEASLKDLAKLLRKIRVSKPQQ